MTCRIFGPGVASYRNHTLFPPSSFFQKQKRGKGFSGKEREDRKGILPLTSASLFRHASRGGSRCENGEKELSIKQLLLWFLAQKNCCEMQRTLFHAPTDTRGQQGQRVAGDCPTTTHTQIILLLAPPHSKLSQSKSLIQNTTEEEVSIPLCKKTTVFCMLARTVLRHFLFVLSRMPLKMK